MRSTLALFLTGAASLLTTSGHLAAQTGTPPPITCEAAGERRWVEGTPYKAGDAVISPRGNYLWICKGGSATALCGAKGYEPDADLVRALQAWEPTGLLCGPQGGAAELQTTDVVVASAKCVGTLAVVTLTATIINNSGFRGETDVAFYHSDGKSGGMTLIKAEPTIFPEETFGEPVFVSTTWRTPAVGTATITVVADDDGTGYSQLFERNESDNLLAVKLPTCPVPSPGPGPVQPPQP